MLAIIASGSLLIVLYIEKGLLREMAIRSAPCPSTSNSTDLEFLASLKNYLQGEKSKIDERLHARASKSTERF